MKKWLVGDGFEKTENSGERDVQKDTYSWIARA